MVIEPSDMDREEFMEVFGPVFEHSPWIAEDVWNDGVEMRHDTVPAMHEAMCNEIRRASHEAKLELLRAHPELRAMQADHDLTSHSHGEQTRSGLDKCSAEEKAEFDRLNSAYREKFGFPFILAIKGYQRKQILEIFKRRLEHGEEEEFQAALGQVMKIALFRLQDIFQ